MKVLMFAEGIENFIDGIGEAVSDFVEGVQNVNTLLDNARESVLNVGETVKELTTTHSIEGVSINTYVGAFHWLVGDVIFTEIYVLIIIAVIFLTYELVGKFIELLQWIFGKIGKWFTKDGIGAAITSGLSNNKLTAWLAKLVK